MALFSRKNISNNPYGLKEEDLIDAVEGFPMSIIVRMLEEQEAQGNSPNVKVFQEEIAASLIGFSWDETEDGWEFWSAVLILKDFKRFFKKYPEYEKYNLS